MHLRIVAAPAAMAMREGARTRGLRYGAEVLRGRRDALAAAAGNLGPTLDLRRGERVRIEVVNKVGEETVIHWHGMLVPEAADGHPHQAVASGERYSVDFTVLNPAGTYLYHPHPHGVTGRQTYAGLAGLIVVREPAEREMGLPSLPHELPLVLQDRRFRGDNQLVYKRMMMDDMNGVLGDTVLVNGVAYAAFKVTPRPYRLRIANASNARIYKLAWSDGRPLRVIAADNGLFSRAEGIQERTYVTLFPFERIEVLEDFGARRDGAEFALVSQAFSGLDMMDSMMGGRGMMGGMMGPSQGMGLHIARFTVLPGPRPRARKIALPDDRVRAAPKGIELRTQLAFRHMRGFLNGRSFDTQDMTTVADDERLPVGRASVWSLDLRERRARHAHAAPHAHPRRAFPRHRAQRRPRSAGSAGRHHRHGIQGRGRRLRGRARARGSHADDPGAVHGSLPQSRARGRWHDAQCSVRGLSCRPLG